MYNKHDNYFILHNIFVCTEQLNIVECEVEHGIFIYIIYNSITCIQ